MIARFLERFAYDGISWLDYIAEETPDGSAVVRKYDYTFQLNRPFVQTVDFYQGTTAMLTQSYAHDGVGRLTGASATRPGNQTVAGVNVANLKKAVKAML